MNANRKLCRLLAALIASATMLATLAACGTADDPVETDPTSQTVAESEEDTELKDSLPDDLDYKDEKLTIIANRVMSYDSLTGVALEDAISVRTVSLRRLPTYSPRPRS